MIRKVTKTYRRTVKKNVFRSSAIKNQAERCFYIYTSMKKKCRRLTVIKYIFKNKTKKNVTLGNYLPDNLQKVLDSLPDFIIISCSACVELFLKHTKTWQPFQEICNIHYSEFCLQKQEEKKEISNLKRRVLCFPTDKEQLHAAVLRGHGTVIITAVLSGSYSQLRPSLHFYLCCNS